MIGPEPVQAYVDTFSDPLGTEIKVRQVVATELGAERVTLPRHTLQRDTEQYLAHAAAVKRRGVDEVQPRIQRHPNARQRFIELYTAKLPSEGGCSKAQDRQLQPGIAQQAGRNRRTHMS